MARIQVKKPRGDSGDGKSSRPHSTKRPILLFVFGFLVLWGLFYALTAIPVVNTKVLPAYMRLNAQASAAILTVFGENSTAQGTSITGRFPVSIAHGCDAVAPSVLFAAAVLAFPAPFRRKILGALVGVAVLATLNLVRIISLYYVGVFRPAWFEPVHVDVWQPFFIVLSLALWVVWAWWATAEPASARHHASETD